MNQQLETERGSTRSHCVENWLWKRLWTCRKADCRVNFMKVKTRFRVHLSVAVTVVMCIVSRLIAFYTDDGALYRALALLELI
jgi:hypothetical protein